MTIRYNLEHGFAGAKSRSESDCGMPAVGIAIPDPDKQLTSNKTYEMLFALGRFIFSLHIFSYHLHIAILVSHFPCISNPSP